MIVEFTVENVDNPLESFDYLDYDEAKIKIEAMKLQGKRVRFILIDENGNEKKMDMQGSH